MNLKIPIPFSLVSNDVTNDKLVIMPAYWFMYNMYALARNAWKYIDRDKRIERIQHIEYDFLAPDTVNEIMSSISLLEELVGKSSFNKKGEKAYSLAQAKEEGKKLLEDKNFNCTELEIDGGVFENSKRKVLIIKVSDSYRIFKKLVDYYAARQIIEFVSTNEINDIAKLPNCCKANRMVKCGWSINAKN